MGMLATKKDDSDLAEALFLEAVLVLDRLPEARRLGAVCWRCGGDVAIGVRVSVLRTWGLVFFFCNFCCVFLFLLLCKILLRSRVVITGVS